MNTVVVDGREVRLSNLDKVYWPEGITKEKLVRYYSEIAPVIVPHLMNRPLVMKRYPDGINGESFYQKECPDYAPDWIETYPVRHSEKVVNYVVCNDAASLVWLANQGCIEMQTTQVVLTKTDYKSLYFRGLQLSRITLFSLKSQEKNHL